MLFDITYFTPRGYDFTEDFKDPNLRVYREIYDTLKKIGHEISLLGIYNDLSVLWEEIRGNRPDVVFNLADVFNNKSHLDKNIAALLEMMEVVYTGASQSSLLLCNNKSLTKKILTYHRIKVPNFHVFYRDRKVWVPKPLKFPMIVKPLREEASRGIAQVSFVDDEKSFLERVKFVHESMNEDVIVEEYIDGREFYVSLWGNKRIKVLPMREMIFGKKPEDEPRIATYMAKWNDAYRKKWGMRNVFAQNLPEGWEKKINTVCKRAYRALNMKCYARFDVRVTGAGEIYIIEANANPNLEKDDEFAQSAKKVGISHEALVQKLIALALKRGFKT